jgi:hypothetical protein
MNQLKPSLVLTLIGLALFLSAADPIPKPSPVPRNTPQPSKAANFSHQNPEQYPTDLGTPNNAHAPDRTPTSNQEQKGGHNIGSMLMVTATVIMAIATALMAWFNWQLVGVTNEMTSATKDMAKAAQAATLAAHKSAEAATLALNAERPYIFVERPEIRMSEVKLPALSVPDPYRDFLQTQRWLWFDIRNRGKGVAIIEEI